MKIDGTYPFGSPLSPVIQRDRSPKRVFVLGVYASAVYARWQDGNGKTLVKALAVASEPTIFWDGSGADEIVSAIPMEAGAGTLEAAAPKFNSKFSSSAMLTEEEFDALSAKTCQYCGVAGPNGVDRLDSTKGYGSKNCVPCCKHCNYVKGDLPMGVSQVWAKRFTAYQARHPA